MMTLTAVFWMYVILFGIIGGFRGWAKELLVLFSVLLAIAIDTVLLTYVESVQVVMATRPGITQFALRSSLILILASGMGHGRLSVTVVVASRMRGFGTCPQTSTLSLAESLILRILNPASANSLSAPAS